jgi:hypothetical protein
MKCPTRKLPAMFTLGLFYIFCGGTRSSAGVVFSDSTFDLANYNQIEFVSNPSITVSVSQTLTGGDPGAALQILIGQPGSNAFSLNLGFLNTSFVYDPAAQGQLLSLNASVDGYVQSSNRSLNILTFNPIIFQSGNYYIANIVIPGSQGIWNAETASGLTASDFDLLSFATGTTDSTQHPDFSGGVMLLGLEAGVSADGSRATNYDLRNDNLVFSLNSAVPEPGSLTLALLGATGIGIVCRARRN